MLNPEQMSRILIAATRDQMGPVISELYHHNMFHIEDYVEASAEGYDGFKIGTPLTGASEASGDLVKIRAIQNAFSIRSDDFEVQQRHKQSGLQALIGPFRPITYREGAKLTADFFRRLLKEGKP